MWSMRTLGCLVVIVLGVTTRSWSQTWNSGPGRWPAPTGAHEPYPRGPTMAGPAIGSGTHHGFRDTTYPATRTPPAVYSPLVTLTAPVVPLPSSDGRGHGVVVSYPQTGRSAGLGSSYPRTHYAVDSVSGPVQPMVTMPFHGHVGPGHSGFFGTAPYRGEPSFGPMMTNGPWSGNPNPSSPPSWPPSTTGSQPWVSVPAGHDWPSSQAVMTPGGQREYAPQQPAFATAPMQVNYPFVTVPAETIPTPRADHQGYSAPTIVGSGVPDPWNPSGAQRGASIGSWNTFGATESSPPGIPWTGGDVPSTMVPSVNGYSSGSGWTAGTLPTPGAVDWANAIPLGVPGVGGGSGFPWYASVHALYMTRDDENPFYFSYDDADRRRQLMPARSVNFDWTAGADVRIGRTFDCDTQAIEFGYWGLYPGQQELITQGCECIGELMGTLNWEKLNYGKDNNGDPYTADYYVDHAKAHLLRRDAEAHNFELNWMQCLVPCKPLDPCHGPRFQHRWLVGVRYFKFHDNLLFGSDWKYGNGKFRYENDELYYNIVTNNNLIGPQLGGSGKFLIHPQWTLRYDVKFGMYGNHIEHRSVIGGSRGIATINSGVNRGEDFCVHNSKNDVSFLGEIDLGFTRCITPRLSVSAGYRAVAVAGIAHPTDQIPHDLRMIQNVDHIDSNGSLVLHGGYLGAEYSY